MRVHELAKELEVESKDVLSILEKNNINDKKPQSAVSDEEADIVRKAFSGKKSTKDADKKDPDKKEKAVKKEATAKEVKEETPKASKAKKEVPKEEPKKEAKEEPKAETKTEPKKEQPKEEVKEEPKAEQPKKKISVVFNPRNSSSGYNYSNKKDSRQVIGPNGQRGDRGAKEQQPKNVDVSKAFADALNDGKKEAPEKKETVAQNNQMPTVTGPRIIPGERVIINKDDNRGNRPNRDRNDRQNRDNRNGNDRPFNRDNRNGNDRNDRPFNRDNRNGNDRNDRPFNRDNRNGNDRNDRPFNRDNRNGNDRNDRPFNRDNKGGQAGRGGDAAPDIRQNASKKHNSAGHGKKDKKDYYDNQENSKLTRNDINKNKPVKKEEEEIKVITIPEVLTIKDLADKLKKQPSELIKKLFLQGKIVTVNQEIDFETAEEIALEYEVICEKEIKIDMIEELLKEEEEDPKTLKPRPPVVCVMGHVDHGKTSLLDAIRETNVTSHESGGITQHIGAYTVEKNGKQITFLDTPGHEAFTAMRMRGAQSTDIAILVVAADDGVMPQTVEAINHAKAADIHIIVAINKIDKPSANIDKVKQELSEYELIPEDWGGTTIFVPVSAHTGEGIDELLEMVLLDADMCELTANPNRMARGLVLEAKLDKGKGSVANVLVQKGTLHVGDAIAAGEAFGKVRAMMDDKGRRIKVAGPSTPVEILGLNGVPNAGETFVVKENEKEARSFASVFVTDSKEKLIEGTKAKLSLDDLFSQIQAGEVKELELIVKADVQGSVEAMKQSLAKLSNDEVVVKVIHSGVGAITESDVTLASASNAIIIGFNVKPDNQASAVAESEKVDVRLYNVIYNAIEDIEAAMKGLLDPIYEEKVIGHAEIRQTFKASGVGTIAGSYVLDGMFKRDCKARITRDDEQIFDGNVASLKRFKDDVKEVKAGYECGLVFEDFNDIREGDLVEAYEMVEVPR